MRNLMSYKELHSELYEKDSDLFDSSMLLLGLSLQLGGLIYCVANPYGEYVDNALTTVRNGTILAGAMFIKNAKTGFFTNTLLGKYSKS